jgi:N-methylhydantoinase A/oxoprolinase/acetone carboxylase beta subunit
VTDGGLRIGIDVGGTFTKAVAVDAGTLELRGSSTVPTTHDAAEGVAAGIAQSLDDLLAQLGEERARVEFVAFSTTQAMNALLEGDVARVGVVGLAGAAELRLARKRTKVGSIELAAGRALETAHEALEAKRLNGDLDAALERLGDAGCTSIAVSGAFAVDDPSLEELVAERARARGLPVCAGHELSGAYGLETRTVSAAINASILPVVERTAAHVEEALARADLRVPLLVLRGDGGAMSVSEFRRRPSLTVGSGPAAGVAAALHQLAVRDAIVIECGGTSSNVSVVKGGRPVLRTLRVMGRPTCIRAIDSWVVGAAGGSLARVQGRKLAEVGPRSAHVAGLPYACFADPSDLRDAELELVAPRAGDPQAYATVRSPRGRFALTATCAANALGLVAEGAYARGSRESALLAFEPLAVRLKTTSDEAARRVLGDAARKIARAVQDAARQHELGEDVPLVALGGAGEALVGEVARMLHRKVLHPRHPEVLSSIGAALSLVRAERTRSAVDSTGAAELAHEAERACVAAGAAPATVAVETSYDPKHRLLRAVATGAVALETGAATRTPMPIAERHAAAAAALGVEEETVTLLAENDFYRVYSENGSGRVAVVDELGVVPVAENACRLLSGSGSTFVGELAEELRAGSLHLGVATMLPRVLLVCGSRILDLSDARRAEEILAAAERVLAEHDSSAVAVVIR